MIHAESRGPVRVVTIDRPERRNALDRAAVDDLLGAVSDVPDGTRALVLRGADGHFCAGADLTGVEDEAFTRQLRRLLDALQATPFVTLAAADGAALGAGTQLAVACDLRVATPGAQFGIPAARLGLAVDAWTVHRIGLLAGQGPARAMLLAAEVVIGEDAHRLGLVQRLGAPEDALAWAGEIAALAPLTIQAHKAAFACADQDAEVDAAIARAWASDDAAEGIAAFRERRRPAFRGR